MAEKKRHETILNGNVLCRYSPCLLLLFVSRIFTQYDAS